MKSIQEHANLVVRQSSFATTKWSVVLNAGSEDAAISSSALTTLFEIYWFPLYAYVRRRGIGSADAQDVVQGFFTRLLEKNTLADVTAERGRFRSFLLTAIKHFLANERERAHAQKRGGDQRQLSLDFQSGESRLSIDPLDSATPERIFERQWALTLLESVLGKLAAEYQQTGKDRHFAVLKKALAGSGERVGYTELGAQLGLSEGAARQAASRLRKRYREILREEVASTVAEPDEVDDEIRMLFQTLSEFS